MKGSNSRFSHRATARYSTVAHVQGGMVTDADLTEAGQLHQARSEAMGRITVAGGAPAEGGLVDTSGAEPRLRSGMVVAEGKIGRFESRDGATGLGAYLRQADLPDGPDEPSTHALLYADLWERPVVALQDPYLSDPGLHGAETSYRTKTMVQLKTHPMAEAEDGEELARLLADMADPPLGSQFARIGNAEASVAARRAEIALDECDPCAEEVEVAETLPNALFRIEAVRVTRAGTGRPTAVRLAWSFENAAAVETAEALGSPDAREAFARDGHVYEFFSETTEAHIGRFRPDFTVTDPVFQATPEPPAGDFTHARRWDGFADYNIASETAGATTGTGRLAVVGTTTKSARISVAGLAVTIRFKDAEVLAGDYWLVEVRRFAAEEERLRMVGADAAGRARPVGIRHHLVPLFRMEEDEMVALNDAERRRLTMPALSDLPASHVSYEPGCTDRYPGVETVQDALDALCHLDAGHIRFEPDADCARFEGVTSVEGALTQLCKVEDTTDVSRILRHMMDWGVICGLNVTQIEGTKIRISPGAMLDRAGRFIEVSEQTHDLAEVAAKGRVFGGNLEEFLGKGEEICLALAADDRLNLQIWLVPRRLAFGPADRTMEEVIEACLKRRKWLDFGEKVFRPADDRGKRVIEDMIAVWKNRQALSGAVPLKTADRNTAVALNRTLLTEFEAVAEPEETERVKKLWEVAARAYQPNRVSGPAREAVSMQLESAKLGIIAKADEDRLRRCRCEAGVVPCPPALGEAPLFVPLACLEVSAADNDLRRLDELCLYCCRKQAMTWRSFRYYEGDVLAERFEQLERLCCEPKKDPERDAELRAMAQELIEKVQAGEGPQQTESLNSYERYLVHSEAKDASGVTTRSIGDGLHKAVEFFAGEG
ncbi:MAG: R3H domain-containing nucleic acid-binding protein, partial [Pseudomonadota bacterium]